MDPRLRRGVIHLAILPGLAIYRTNIHDTAEFAGIHAFPDQLAKIVAGTKVCIYHCIPHVAVQLAHRSIARDASIIHQDFNWPHFGFDFRNGFSALREIGDIEFIAGNTGAIGECFRRRIIAGIGSNHSPPRRLKPFADRSPNASLATGNKCNTRHDISLLNRLLWPGSPVAAGPLVGRMFLAAR